MIPEREYVEAIRGLRYIRRTGRRLAYLSKGRGKVSEEEMVDAEYVNECLWIELCRLGLEEKDSMGSEGESLGEVEIYRQCLRNASWQAGQLLRGLRQEYGKRKMVPHNTWCNVESAEALMQGMAFCFKIYSKGKKKRHWIVSQNYGKIKAGRKGRGIWHERWELGCKALKRYKRVIAFM